jgi:hypothetical protein
MWIHQLLEYLLGACLLLVGVRRHGPMRWAVVLAAVAITMLSATTDAALGAWPKLDRRLHLVADAVAVAGLVLIVAMVDGGRDGAAVATLLGVGAAIAWLAVTTRWEMRPRRRSRRD